MLFILLKNLKLDKIIYQKLSSLFKKNYCYKIWHTKIKYTIISSQFCLELKINNIILQRLTVEISNTFSIFRLFLMT